MAPLWHKYVIICRADANERNPKQRMTLIGVRFCVAIIHYPCITNNNVQLLNYFTFIPSVGVMQLKLDCDHCKEHENGSL